MYLVIKCTQKRMYGYILIVTSVRFSPKFGCVEKFVKYCEIPLS